MRRFANFPKELDPDEGELTRTRKLRREFSSSATAPLIDALYAGRTRRTRIPVTYQDGRKAVQDWCAAAACSPPSGHGIRGESER